MPDTTKSEATPEKMQALRLHERGGAAAMVVDDDVAVPSPGIGDVLVRVHAASLTPTELGWPSNWVDHAGADRTPVIPCHEVCGAVVELGYGTTGLAVGDEVFGITDWYRDGAGAEYVTVEARNLARKPRSCTAAEAAALALPALTAQQALFELGGLTKGQTVLIPGVTGGVGTIAIQLARSAAATVIATGRRDRAAAALELGADDFVEIDDVYDHSGIDLVFDLVGGDFLDGVAQHHTAPRIVSVVAPHAGVTFFVVVADRPTLEQMAGRVDDGTLHAVVGETVPLADGARAFAETHGAPGKRVIEVLRT